VFVQEFPLQALILIAFFLLLAFPIHEFAHAFAAYRLGDATAKLFGRLTLNPIAHFDRFGGTMLVLSILVAGFPFGFAQTPVNPRNLRGRYGEAIVAAAGPISNLLMAAVVAIPLRILEATPDLDPVWVVGDLVVSLSGILHLIVYLSVLLGLFNLIPVPPLDGGTILLTLVPPRTAWQLRPFLSQYGLLILIVLIIPFGSGGSILGRVLGPIADSIYGVLVG
jgi:Zn-dependent protease